MIQRFCTVAVSLAVHASTMHQFNQGEYAFM